MQEKVIFAKLRLSLEGKYQNINSDYPQLTPLMTSYQPFLGERDEEGGSAGKVGLDEDEKDAREDQSRETQ